MISLAQDTLLQVLVLLVGAVVTVAVFRRLHLPPILAYLAVGVIVGPHGLGWIADTEDTRFLAEFGVVFLLFTVGLEFSIPQLIAMKKEVLGLGGAQVVISALVAAGLAWAFGFHPAGAVVVGGALAMSSTAIVIKQLTEQLELSSRHGRLSIGVLLFQDVAVIPFLIVIPALAGYGEDSVASELGLALLKGGAVLGVMLAIGHWFLRPLFHEVASARSSELFTLTVLLFSLAAAWLTHEFGLSLALGGFVAGMMLGETEFRHQVEADIRPFRDVLLGLFFVTIGMLLDIHALPGILHWVALVVLGIILVKGLLIAGLSLLFGAEKGVALRTAAVLAEGGEFGLALLSLGLAAGLITAESSQIVLAAVIVSMAFAPALIRYNGWLAKTFAAASYGADRVRREQEIAADMRYLNQHVLICGYGRVGQNIARFLDEEGFRYAALDLDPVRVREARVAGDNVHYGDSTHIEILEAAGLARARAMVISFDDPQATSKILRQVRAVRPDIPVLVRTRDDANLERFQRDGASEVVPETLEASLMLVSHLMLLLGVSVSKIVRRVRDVRGDRYRMLRAFFHGDESLALEEADTYRDRLHAVNLPAGAHAVGHRLGELGLEEIDVQVTAVRRQGIRLKEPRHSLELQEGDVLVLYGSPEHLETAEARLLQG